MFGHGALDISNSFRTMGGIGNIIGYKAETKTFATETLSIDERYEAKKIRDDVASYDSAVALAASSQADATYGKWVKVDYPKTLETVINKYDDGEPQPFKNIIQGGSDNSFTSHGSLRLDNSDTWGTSGSFHAKLAKNWMVKINLWSDNFNYFEDNLKDNKIDLFDDDSFSGNGDGYTDWINFWLIEENDYFSLDIDNERSDTAQLKVVIEGVTYTSSNPPNSDNEAKVWLKEVWHWNPTFGTIAYTPEQDDDNDTNEDEELECKDSDCKADEKAVKKTGWNGVETCECSSDFGQDDTKMTKTKLAMIAAGGVAVVGLIVYGMKK
ncbi:MAG: hypothetical protein HN820_06275 [Candidatus Marinimicrobia bacterium]|jgi:hypothetical protein|nr:hypothetical protein [Candidatus Neomarinimicrobiota bacterium]